MNPDDPIAQRAQEGRDTTSGNLFVRLYAVLLVLAGVALAAGGVRLATIGGSAYYCVAGILLVTSGLFIWLRRREGAWLYAIALLATISWSIWEVGGDGWALVPRLVAWFVLGLGMLMPSLRWATVTFASRPRAPMAIGLGTLFVSIAAGFGLHALSPPLSSPDPLYQAGQAAATAPGRAVADESGDWRNFGNDSGGSRFSALHQITPANVVGLTRVWTYRIGATEGLEVTPLKIGRTLYLCNSTNDVVALEAETGRQTWRFHAGINVDPGKMPHPVCRGVGYYRVPNATGACAARIIANTIDARLIALDAATGRPCAGFGVNGQITLLKGMGSVTPGYYYPTSAPTIVRGKVVLGGWVADNQYWGEPSGVIRAFDAVTGRFVWAFDIGRPERQSEPPAGETYTLATPNSWAPMSADEDLGLVYAPMGNATPDFFGAQRRPIDDAYSSSVTAIDAETGKSRWSFQTMHHDIWDYDVSSQPTLVDVPIDGRVRKALIQATKRGEVFLLDRVTGVPLKPVVERRAPSRGAAPEERLSPTQPFSIGFPSFRGPDLHETDMWGVTPLDQLWCRIRFREARYEGPLTPPGLTPAIYQPGYVGGMDWGSVSIDMDRQLMFVNANRVMNYARLLPRPEADRRGMRAFGVKAGEPFDGAVNVPQAGTSYGAQVGAFMSPLGVPCNRPPYGTLSAVDIRTGKLVWTRALGTARDSGPLGLKSMLPLTMGVPNLGGSLATRGGLLFIAAAQDDYLRAFETATGRLLWQSRLPAGGQANPISYLSPESRRQFIVIAAAGNKGIGTTLGDYIVAYALPRR